MEQPSFSAAFKVKFLFFLFLFHFQIVLNLLDVISERFHVVVNTGLDLVLGLEFESTFTMGALLLTQVSLLGVQVNFWAGVAHDTLDVIRVLRWNLVANWLDGLI